VINKKERIVDYRKRRTEHTPIFNNEAVVEQVESFKFLGIHINKLAWSKHTKAVMKRARPNPFPIKKRFAMGPQILKKVLQQHH
jgi:hypothetical protein